MEDEIIDVKKIYLITGVAGFIGFYLSKSLLDKGCKVIGIDNVNSYYDVNLKYERLNKLLEFKNFKFFKEDISDKAIVMNLFEKYKPNIVINLAAQAGVSYSKENPDVYIESNIIGFFNILEGCRYNPVEHLIYASSSSVYGANKKVPFDENDFVDNPVSLYAATKKANELIANAYSHLYKIPSTGLRFFTVYGPMGRPDMAYFTFLNKYFNGEAIKIFNNGDFNKDLYRDFTYIDDVIEGIERLISKPPIDIKDNSYHRVFNIGNNKPEKLMVFIEALEEALSKELGRKIEFNKIFEPLREEDVPMTYASTEKLDNIIDFKPNTDIKEGLKKFVIWYLHYYEIKTN